MQTISPLYVPMLFIYFFWSIHTSGDRSGKIVYLWMEKESSFPNEFHGNISELIPHSGENAIDIWKDFQWYFPSFSIWIFMNIVHWQWRSHGRILIFFLLKTLAIQIIMKHCAFWPVSSWSFEPQRSFRMKYFFPCYTPVGRSINTCAAMTIAAKKCFNRFWFTFTFLIHSNISMNNYKIHLHLHIFNFLRYFQASVFASVLEMENEVIRRPSYSVFFLSLILYRFLAGIAVWVRKLCAVQRTCWLPRWERGFRLGLHFCPSEV